MKRITKSMVTMAAMAGLVMGMAFPAEAKVSNSKILKGYAAWLREDHEEPFKYFALVDANKDGSPELLAVSKMSGGKIKSMVDFVSFYKNSGEACSIGGYGTTPYLYYNVTQKGILFEKDQYEYMNGTQKGRSGKYFSSNVKTIMKDGKKYIVTEGHISGEYDMKTQKVSAATVKKYRKSWAFSQKSRGTKKVKFVKITKSNLKKLEQGKIQVQK